jgi:hypothetical protein
VVEELNQSNENSDKKKGRHTTHKNKIRGVPKMWESKVRHDQCIRSTDRQLISEEDTFLWLSSGDPKA